MSDVINAHDLGVAGGFIIEAAMHGDIDQLKSENAKLRMLAAILCHCMRIKASCDDCRINGHKGELARDPLAACDGLHRMLRELGIEVDV